jgi:hypothetical protein
MSQKIDFAVLEETSCSSLVSCFNLLHSFNYTPYLFYKKRFKSELNSFCLWAMAQPCTHNPHLYTLGMENISFHQYSGIKLAPTCVKNALGWTYMSPVTS